MKRDFIYLLFLPFISLYAESTHIQADHIRYQQQHLALDGHVLIDHPMANLSSEHALLETKAKQLLKAVAEGSVSLVFPNQSSLSCEIATIDFQTLQGSMGGKIVSFRDSSHTYQNLPLQILGPKMNFELIPLGTNSYDVSKIRLQDGIEILYSDAYSLKGDLGEYRHEEGKSDVIEVMSHTPYGCEMIHEKQQMKCNSILYEIEKSLLHIDHAKGFFHHPARTESIYFETDHVSYDELYQECLFQEKSYLSDEEWGQIYSEGSVLLWKEPFVSTFSFDHMDTKGKVFVDFISSGEKQRLECYGTTYLDKNLGSFRAIKPTFAIIPHSQFRQNVYERGSLKVLCDELTMEIEKKPGALIPTLLRFAGHVQVLSKEDLAFDRVICDELIYDLSNDIMTLSAHEGNAISFHKSSCEMVLQAEKIQIFEKKRIKAIGKTEFVFSTDEKNILKKALKKPPR